MGFEGVKNRKVTGSEKTGEGAKGDDRRGAGENGGGGGGVRR